MLLRNQFGTNGIFDLPVIKNQEVDLQNISLVGYDQTKVDDKNGQNSFVHFFWMITSSVQFGMIQRQEFRSYAAIKVCCRHNSAPITLCQMQCKYTTLSVRGGAGLFTGKWYNSYSNRFMGVAE